MSVALAFTATNGDAYDLHMGRWSRRLAELFLDFVGVADGEQVLDLGCGTGSLTYALAQRVKNQTICGVDIAEAYIEAARQRSNNPQIVFRVGNATAIPLPDNSVDRVLSLLLLSFVQDTQGAMAEMRRVARPRRDHCGFTLGHPGRPCHEPAVLGCRGGSRPAGQRVARPKLYPAVDPSWRAGGGMARGRP